MHLPKVLENIGNRFMKLFKQDDVRGPPFLLSTRFLMALLAFLALIVQNMHKMMTSISIVCMINNTWIKEQSQTSSISTQSNYSFSINDSYLYSSTTTAPDQCFFKHQHASIDGTLKWAKDTQGLVLSSFFWGYIITQIPGGYLSTRFGARIVLFIAFLVASTATLLLPVSARFSFGLFLVLRVINGAAFGVLWPSIASMWSRWAPPEERSLLLSIGNSGSQIGNAIALPIGSFLCLNGFDQGWGSLFYIFAKIMLKGIISIVWCIIWILLSSDSPGTHRFIRKEERDYILNATKDTSADHAEYESLKDAPWKEIMTSIPCISFYITLTFNNWGAYTFLTNIPTYMKEILKFDIKSIGGLSAIPYILFWILIIISGNIADRILKANKLDRTTVRKMFNATSNFIPMFAVIGLIFIDCTDPYGGLVLLCLGLAFTGTGYGAGFMVNANDIAGNYSGVVFGIGNTLGTIPGIIAPYIVGILTPNSLQSEWQNVFIIAAVLYFVSGVQSLILTSGEQQQWSTHTPNQQKIMKPTKTKEDKRVIITEMHEIELEHEEPPKIQQIANIKQIDPSETETHINDKTKEIKNELKQIEPKTKTIDNNEKIENKTSSILTDETWNDETKAVTNQDSNPIKSVIKTIETSQPNEQQQQQHTPHQERRTDSKKVKSNKYIKFP